MPQHTPDQAMAAIDGMLGGGVPPAPPDLGVDQPPIPGGAPMGATPGPSGEGDVVAALVSENVQLRALLGLGPNDPIPPVPMGEGPAGPAGAGLPPV